MAKNWLKKYDEGGDVPSNKYNSIPTGIIKRPKVFTTTRPSYYSASEQTMYLNPNENFVDPSIYQHEMFHHWQNLNDQLRVPEAYEGPLAKPNMLANDASDYYNRRAVEIDKEFNNFYNTNPTFQLVNPDLVYDKQVNPSLYSNPNYAEGEAQAYQDYVSEGGTPMFMHKKGGLIKRADGSYSRRGLWDNIRANKGSGRKPTKEMLEQERKIKKHEDGGGVGGGGKSPSKKYWTEKDVDAKYWKTFKEKYPYAIGVDPYHVDKDNNHLPVFEDLKLTQSKGIVPIDNNSYDDELKPMTSIPFVPQEPIRKIVNPDFQESDYTEKHNSIVDPLGNPRYKYYNQDKVIGQNEYNRLKGFRDGSWIADSSLPTPTSPSYYSAGEDTTLTNYQMGTPKAPMYKTGGPTGGGSYEQQKNKYIDAAILGQPLQKGVIQIPNPKFDSSIDNLPNRKKQAVVDALGNPRYMYLDSRCEDGDCNSFHYFNTPKVTSMQEYQKSQSMPVHKNGGPVMYNAGSTVWTNQDTPLWAAGTPTPTATQNFRNTGSLNTSRYRIGDVIPTGMDYKTPAAGTYDYNKDVQPPKQMVLHAPDTLRMGDGGDIKKHINSPRVYGSPVNPSGMSEGPTTQRGITFGKGGLISMYADAGVVADCPDGYVKDASGNCIPVTGVGLAGANLRQSFLNSQQQAANTQAQVQSDLQAAKRGVVTQPASTTYVAPKNLTAKQFSQDLGAAGGNMDRMNLMNGLKEAKRQEQPSTIKAISDNPNENPFIIAEHKEGLKEGAKTALKAVPLVAAYEVPLLATLLDAGFIAHGISQVPETVEAWKDPNVSAWDATKQTAGNALEFLPTLTIGGHSIDAIRNIKYKNSNLFNFLAKKAWNKAETMTNPVTKDYMVGAAYGLNDLSAGRPFFETFPMTPGQVKKMKMRQDEAAAGAADWIKDWYYPDRIKAEGEGFRLLNPTPNLDKNAYNISQANLRTAQTTDIPAWNSSMILDARPVLTTTRSRGIKQDIAKQLNLDVNSKEVAFIADKVTAGRGRLQGVMLNNMPNYPITFRNHGLFYHSPINIRNTTGHELTHTADVADNAFQYIAEGSPFYSYGIPAASPLGMEFKNAMPVANNEYELFRKDLDNQGILSLSEDIANAPTHLQKQLNDLYNKSYLWEGFPGELHAELASARMKTYDDYKKEGFTHDAIMQVLKNPSDNMLEHLIYRGDLNRFFKPNITDKTKYKLMKKFHRDGGYVNKYADGDFVGNEPTGVDSLSTNNTGYPLLQNAINSQMNWAPQDATLPIDPRTGMPIKVTKEITIMADRNSPQQWEFLTEDYNRRQAELEEDPSKWNIKDWTTYGIQEGDATAEGIYDPLNWPAMALGAVGAAEGLTAAGTAALPYTTAALGTLSAPAVIGGNSIPWLTADNLMTAYFGSKVPGNIQEGNYVEAGLNSMPFWFPKVATGVTKTADAVKNVANEYKNLKNINVPYIGETPIMTEGMNNYNKLTLKSTQTGSELERQVSKAGNIHINNLNAYINKPGVSQTEKAVMNQVLQEKFAGQTDINYDLFKSEVTNKLVQLEREVVPNYQYTNYGYGKLGYESVSKESVLKSNGYLEDSINDIRLRNDRMKTDLEETKKIFANNPEHSDWLTKHEEETLKLIEDNNNFIQQQELQLQKNLKMLDNIPEGETAVYSNVKQFGMGNNAHFNPSYVNSEYLDGTDMAETLGHARSFVSAEEPTIKHIVEAQSDFAQKKYSRMSKDKADLEQKVAFTQSDVESANNLMSDYQKELNFYKSNNASFFNMSQSDYTNKITQLEDAVKYFENRKIEKLKELELNKASLKNFEQKLAYQNSAQERLVQEEVSQAAREGLSTVRFPTKETAIKVQGYPQLSRQATIDTNQAKLDILKDPEAYKAANGEDHFYQTVMNTFKHVYHGNTQQYMDKLTAEIAEQTKLLTTNGDAYYNPGHETILKKYEGYDKTLKKLFGTDVKVVTDGKGNTWYQFDVPQNWKQGKGEMKAFKQGGLVTKNNNSNAWLEQYN
jgi:hypothetical protein